MQPQNIAVDPAANPWGNPNSPPHNNMFTSTSSPDSQSQSQNDAAYNMNFYGQNIGNVSGGPMDIKPDQGGPVLSANSPENQSDEGRRSAGEVFMGVQSPVPGGYSGWKWMNEKK